MSGANSMEQAAEALRLQRLEEAMFADLGLARREQISTEEDRRKGKGIAAGGNGQVTRLSDQVGTKEYKLARLNKTGLDGWKSAYQDMERDEEAEMLADIGQGQSHRAALAESLKLSGHQEPNFYGRGGRARGGGRGGGVMGSRGRGGSSSAPNYNAGLTLSTSTPKTFGLQDARASTTTDSQARGPRGAVSVSRRTAAGTFRESGPQAVPVSRPGAAALMGVHNRGGHGVRQPIAKASASIGQTGRTNPPPQARVRSRVAASPAAPRSALPLNTNYEARLTSGAAWMSAQSKVFGRGDKATTSTTTTSESSAAVEQKAVPSNIQDTQQAAPQDNQEARPQVAAPHEATLPTVVEPPIQQRAAANRSIHGSVSSQSALGPRSRSEFGVSSNLERLNSLSNPPSQARTISSRVSDLSTSQALPTAVQEDQENQPASLRTRADSLFSTGPAPTVRLPSADLTALGPLTSVQQSYLDDLQGLVFSEPPKPDNVSLADDADKSDNESRNATESDAKTKEDASIQGEPPVDTTGYLATLMPTLVKMNPIAKTQALKKLFAEVQRALEEDSEKVSSHITVPQEVPQGSIQTTSTQSVPEQTVVEKPISKPTVLEQAVLEQTNPTQVSKPKDSKEIPSTQIDLLEPPVPRRDAITPMVPLTSSIHAPKVPLSQSKVLLNMERRRPANWAGLYAEDAQNNVIGDLRNVRARATSTSTTVSSVANTSLPNLANTELGTMQSRFAPKTRRPSILSTSGASASIASHSTFHARTTGDSHNATTARAMPPGSIHGAGSLNTYTSPPAPNVGPQSGLTTTLPTTFTNRPTVATLPTAASLHAPTMSVASSSQQTNSTATTPRGAPLTQSPTVVPAMPALPPPGATTMPSQSNPPMIHENLPLRVKSQESPTITQTIMSTAPLNGSSTFGSEKSSPVPENPLSPRSPNRKQPTLGGGSQESRFADAYKPPSRALQNLHDAVRKGAAAKEEEARKRAEKVLGGGGMTKSKWSDLS